MYVDLAPRFPKQVSDQKSDNDIPPGESNALRTQSANPAVGTLIILKLILITDHWESIIWSEDKLTGH